MLNTDYLNGCESEHKMNELFSYVLEQQPNRDKDPCETCGYVEGSPFCLQYCPYDAERKKEQEPCEDAISRQAVIRIAEQGQIQGYEWQFKELNKLPPVTPQQKYGKWIAVYQGDEIINYRCSECELGDTNGSTNLYGWDYCRRCGAKMQESEEI